MVATSYLLFCATFVTLCGRLAEGCVPHSCPGDEEWECGDGDCIPATWMCSGVRSCADGSDEHVNVCGENCEGVTSPGGGWACKNGECIRGSLQCNGGRDCEDGSDETDFGCGKTKIKKKTQRL